MKTKILIVGRTGLIGSQVAKVLENNNNYDIFSLTRQSTLTNKNCYQWDISKGIFPDEVLDGIEYIIYLSGASIADKRWTKKYKQEIINSRVEGLNLILSRLRELKQKIKALISASAVGIYPSSDKVISEDYSPLADDFIGQCCQMWEQKALQFKECSERVVIFRTGVVLDSQHGAFPKMAQSFRWGLKILFGNGQQYFPYIHLKDIANMYVWALENPNINGIFNAVGSETIQLKNFLDAYTQQRKIPSLKISIPKQILKMGLGEMSKILLNSHRISADKIKEKGFEFTYAKLQDVITHL